MGSGGSTVSAAIQPNTTSRWARVKSQRAHSQLVAEILEIYGHARTGKLSQIEVKKLALSILGKSHTALVGGITNDDIELIMRVGGDSCKVELTAEELPVALSIIIQIKETDETLHGLFVDCDVDQSGALSFDQLKSLLTSVNDDKPVLDTDASFVFDQCSQSGASTMTVDPTELKAAIACWYVLHPTGQFAPAPGVAQGPAPADVPQEAPTLIQVSPKTTPAVIEEEEVKTAEPIIDTQPPAEPIITDTQPPAEEPTPTTQPPANKEPPAIVVVSTPAAIVA